MILKKDKQIKELNSPKAIKRWIGFGWTSEEENNKQEIEQPRRRGRPTTKKED